MASRSVEVSDAALTDADYWDAVWANVRLPRTIDTRRYFGWRWDQWFSRHLQSRQGQRVLEVGCAPGSWLIYFHERWDLSPVGVDFSPRGVTVTRRNFAITSTPGHVHQADFFEAPKDQFDVVWSAGVVEHFPDLDVPMRRLWELTKPGGLLLTEVPNFCSPIYAQLQRWASSEILSRHHQITPADLSAACQRLGAIKIRSGYFGTWNLMIVNFAGRGVLELPAWALNRAVSTVLRAIRVQKPESKLLSPYVVAACERPL